MQVEVPAALDGERLDRAVALLADLSRSEAASLVAGGRVQIDGTPTTVRSRRLREGEAIAVDLGTPSTAQVVADPSIDVAVVHADDSVIVVDKPAGLVVHPGAGHHSGTLVHGLVARFPDIAGVGDPNRPGIVHRLDQGTSGLLVVARTEVAAADLVEQLSRREVIRRYDALVNGTVEADAGIVDAPIARSPRDPTRMAVVAEGRPARTRYRVIARWEDPPVTRLRCELETGRTHQIRVHLAAIGHPVVGDVRYGAGRTLGLDRPFLHAAELAFRHPSTGEQVSFTAPLPADLEAVLDRLGP
jgi:23S rRNA pseudouridine1911/1915/1917 synthase